MYSVIIPAKNESANIARCIRSVFASVNGSTPVEIIVIDNGSSDDTADIALTSGAKVLFAPDVHISGLRNLGVKNASYDVIGFIDADCEALPDWLTNAHHTLLSDNNVGIVGDYYQLPKQPGWIEQAYFETLPRRRREVTYLSGGNMVLFKNVFLRLGGFDEETVTAEDYVLCLKYKKAGYKILSDPAVAVIHHGNSKTLLALLKREVWCGLGTMDIYRYGNITLPLLWSVLNICLLLGLVLCVSLNNNRLAFVLACGLFTLPGCAAYRRSRHGNSYRYLLQLYVIYIVYGSARTISLLKRALSFG